MNSQEKIKEITNAMQDLLLYKNQKYGDSALKPNNVFFKGDATNSILIRLDDKIGRIKSNTEETPRTNDVADIIGYCVLLLISMGVSAEDIAKFKDWNYKKIKIYVQFGERFIGNYFNWPEHNKKLNNYDKQYYLQRCLSIHIN